jgi:hypothetical protein
MTRPAIEWTDEQIKRLGNEPDLLIAKDMGISYSTVHAKRVSLGVLAFIKTRHVAWSKYDSLLGKMTDKDLASKIGCSLNTVFVRRKRKGILPFHQVPDVDWSEWDDKIGVMDDAEIATATGRSVSSVVSRRREMRRLKIMTEPEKESWFNDLGVVNDGEISRRTGLSRQRICQIRQRFNIPSVRQQHQDSIDVDRVLMLMKQDRSNGEICDDTGISRLSLAALRREYKMPAQRGRNRPPQVILDHVDELGTIPDAEFATKHGMNQQSVCYHRNKMGINAFNPISRVDYALATEVVVEACENGHDNEWIASRLGCSINYVPKVKQRVGS